MPFYNRQPISRQDIGPLLVTPVIAASVALSSSTNVTTDGYTFRVPVVLEDPTAAWVAEGAEIPVSDPALGEVVVTPSKVAGLTIVSRELAEDSNPAAATVVGDGLARDIARKVDAAWFGALAPPAPSGLSALAGIQTVTGVFANLDPFAEAISRAETVGATVTAFVCSPATALVLAKLKSGSGSNAPLLGQDATSAGQRRVLGVDVLTSPTITGSTVWAYSASRVWTVIRDDVSLEVDRSVFFTSDRVAVKATMRIGFAFGHPQSVVKLTGAAPTP